MDKLYAQGTYSYRFKEKPLRYKVNVNEKTSRADLEPALSLTQAPHFTDPLPANLPSPLDSLQTSLPIPVLKLCIAYKLVKCAICKHFTCKSKVIYLV